MDEQTQQYNKARLEAARQAGTTEKIKTAAGTAKSIARNRKEIKKRAQQVLSSMSLSRYVDPWKDWLFGIALIFAMLKDIMDFTGLGMFFTIFASIIIFFALFLAGSGGKKNTAASFIKKYGTLAIGTVIEFIFGIDFLPLETLIVVLVYFFTLQERQAEETEAESDKEIRKVDLEDQEENWQEDMQQAA